MNKGYICYLGDIERGNKNGLKVFSCFLYGGDSIMGHKLAEYEIIENNEIDKDRNKVYVKNRYQKYNFNCGISKLINLNITNELYNLDILNWNLPYSVFSLT